jgi:hypothetical protein
VIKINWRSLGKCRNPIKANGLGAVFGEIPTVVIATLSSSRPKQFWPPTAENKTAAPTCHRNGGNWLAVNQESSASAVIAYHGEIGSATPLDVQGGGTCRLS